ncbi:MAG: hypothetical protein JWQ40_3727 [Segetibacter sp.]|jgi:DNA-directed RNA polymerase alpha subunit|nr:hypothetical protein [Segetibacter sp.]
MENNNLPPLAGPATRAFNNAGIFSLEQLSSYTEAEITNLHGVGKNALETVKKALDENGLAFKREKK